MNENLKSAVSQIKYFLLDMDGTIYLGNKPIGDMVSTLNYLREKGKKIIYLTNNSSRDSLSYIEKLKKLNFYSESDEIYSSGNASAEYINENYAGKSVYVLGTQALKNELVNNGVNVVESDVCDIALLAYDTELTYEKLCKFVKAISNGARYLATHPDNCCPSEGGYLPDAGSYIKMIETAVGYKPEIIIGKPNVVMGENLMRRLNLLPNNFMMVGDRLYTDISFGKNCNFYSLLVLSGETTLDEFEKSAVKPDFVLDSLNDIKNYL